MYCYTLRWRSSVSCVLPIGLGMKWDGKHMMRPVKRLF
jgi:hypothetical protein